jgi:hypothetical protein
MRETLPRRGPSPKDRSALLEYFGGQRCVVRGDAVNSTWHHLDDDKSHASYGNFLPLGSSFNTALRDARREARGGAIAVLTHGELTPDVLLRQASVWHAKWQTGLAYGCARLSYYVATAYLHEPPDRALPRACDAIYYARHRFDSRLIEDVLRRDILPQIEDSRARAAIGTRTTSLLLSQLAAICSEFGMAENAATLFDEIETRMRGTVIVDDIRQAALLRRRAMVAGTVGTYNREVDAQLRESIALAGDPNAELSVMTTKAWLLQRKEDWTGVATLLQPLYLRYRPTHGVAMQANALTGWNLAELFYAYGAAMAVVSPRRRRKTEDILRNATTQFALSGARPYEIVPGHRNGLLARLSAAGIAGPRLPHAGKPMSRSLKELTTRAIRTLHGR